MTDGSDEHGYVVEEDVRATAARLGLADFVYRAELVARGGGNREPGRRVARDARFGPPENLNALSN